MLFCKCFTLKHIVAGDYVSTGWLLKLLGGEGSKVPRLSCNDMSAILTYNRTTSPVRMAAMQLRQLYLNR